MYNEQNNNDLNNKEMQSNSESQETFDQQHEYITYGRRFISYKWYKPILVGLVLGILYLIIGSGAICALVMLNHEAVEASGVLLNGYENMDVSSVAGVMVNLGGLAILIPFLWIASKIVKDRPFSSYSSSRGGWNWKLFFKCFLIAIVIMAGIREKTAHNKVIGPFKGMPVVLFAAALMAIAFTVVVAVNVIGSL